MWHIFHSLIICFIYKKYVDITKEHVMTLLSMILLYGWHHKKNNLTMISIVKTSILQARHVMTMTSTSNLVGDMLVYEHIFINEV